MNLLAPTTYYLRHKASALVQVAIVALATAGVSALVSVLDAVPMRANVSYLTKLSRVIPSGDALDPGVVSQVQAYPGVERAIPDNGLWVSLPSLLGTDSQQLLGVSPEDAHVLMQHCGVRLKEGRMLKPRRNELGFVFQQHFLINYLTALENVMVAAAVQDRAHAAQAMALLADLGMKDRLHRFPCELSGGERQRVAIARAMIHRPRVVFADEPTGLLDRRTGLQVMSLLRSYREQGSLIAVTHNPEIPTEADNVITLRDGRLVVAGERSARVIQQPVLPVGRVVAEGE